MKRKVVKKKLAKEIISVKPNILNLQEANDIYMELTMTILTNQTNLNNLKFTDDYINGVVENKERFIGIPLVANRSKLESGQYKKLTHELDKKTGLLMTDSIGSFVDFWSEEDEDGTLKLNGLVRVQKRYPNVCNAMLELYESDDLEFSCEIYAYGYAEMNKETNERTVNYEYNSQVNSLFGSCIVTYPAEPMSKASLLVAEAIEKDLPEGGEQVPEKTIETFNKGVEINFHGELETSALKLYDVSNAIYNLLNPLNPKNNTRKYNYYILDTYTEYVIVEDWNDYQTLYKISYKIENDMVTLDSQDNWVKGYRGFIPEGISIDDLLAEKATLSAELATKINELNELHKEEKNLTEQEIKELQEKATQLSAKITELEGKITGLEGTIVEQATTIKDHETNETNLNNEIQTLKPFKEQVETAEKEAKKNVIVEKFSKLLSEEVMKSEVVVNAIEALDENALNSVVVSEVANEIASKSTKEPKTKDVIVNARNQEDLIPTGLRDKLYASKSE